MNWTGRRVLVTGGTGFAGSHVVEQLLQAGAEVVATYQTQQPRSYFHQQHLGDQCVLAQVDVTDFSALHHLVTKQAIEYIFHLAAQPLVEVAFHNPRQTLATNIMGTTNVLESARLFPTVKAIVVASSDKAYGKLDGGQYVESTPLRGDHPYDVSKSATDLIALTYAKTYQLPVVVSRFGNIYGPGDLNYSRIIPGMMKAIITGEKLVLRSNGTFVRDYLHVRDVAKGYLLMAEKIRTAAGQAFNFGSPDTHSVLDLLSLAEKTLNCQIPYTIKDTAQNEIPYQSLDFTKAKTELGWKPALTLKTSLAEVLAYYQHSL